MAMSRVKMRAGCGNKIVQTKCRATESVVVKMLGDKHFADQKWGISHCLRRRHRGI